LIWDQSYNFLHLRTALKTCPKDCWHALIVKIFGTHFRTQHPKVSVQLLFFLDFRQFRHSFLQCPKAWKAW
jgi:hypothetical protein